ncbi:ABC transporter substrate-binding protein [Arthrobacter castelli]|uniref:ABC transporter substrate-binding protein n=1 Tax=Arthrobacter castelli TaxID=271431 RepID=UPI0003FDBBAD|nr:ABC transporter substrate-binding protein [Arthrobacter castelli]
MKHMFAKAAAAGSVLALALTGCGGGSPSATGESSGSTGSSGSGGSGEGSLTKLTVGVIPIAPSAAVQLGINEGIFKEHGLDISLDTAQGGAAMLPAVSTGDLDVGVGNPLSVILANAQGLNMDIVTGYTNSKSEGDDITGVIADADDNIDSWADLEGKTVAVNTLNGQGDLTIMEAVAQDGGDPQAVNFVEFAFSDMPGQLEAGNIDAAWFPEPFLTQLANKQGMELVGYNYQDTIPGLSTMVTFSSQKFAEGNPEVMKQYRAAMTEVLEFAEQNPDRVREVMTEFLNMPEKTASNLRLEKFDAEVKRDKLQALVGLMQKYGVVEGEIKLDGIINAD